MTVIEFDMIRIYNYKGFQNGFRCIYEKFTLRCMQQDLGKNIKNCRRIRDRFGLD